MINLRKLIVKTVSNRNFNEKEALMYFSLPVPGTFTIRTTKPMNNQKDLSLAYSPGVAVPCLMIAEDPEQAYNYTCKGNSVAVISNGTSVLDLGNLGALASKPAMEGKAIILSSFAGINSFDLCIDAEDPQQFVNCVKYLAPSFGGIHLEDIKGPDCFYIEEQLQSQLQIPVFHDNQHATAIVVLAALINACHIAQKKFQDLKIVISGAGASGIAVQSMLIKYGAKRKNIIVCDKLGIIYRGRQERMNQYKQEMAIDTEKRTLKEAVQGQDVFIGLSVGGILTQEMVKSMSENPIIFAMSNPEPEIYPEQALEVRPDTIIATGRSDFPNWISNILCSPYIFRGALDVRASEINEPMKMAAALALSKIAREPVPPIVCKAYEGKQLEYGRDYFIPTPFDPRLIEEIALATAKAAVVSGVAKIQKNDWKEYRYELKERYKIQKSR